MIEEIAGLPEGTLGFKISGDVTGGDYDSVLTPAIDKAIEKFDRIRLLAQVGPNFEGYSLDAIWDDTKLGLRHWNGFDRVAVVTDVGWIQMGVKAMAFMMPCPVQLFALGELDDAKRWLSESLGSIHIHSEGDVITARLLGKLDPGAYDGVNEENTCAWCWICASLMAGLASLHWVITFPWFASITACPSASQLWAIKPGRKWLKKSWPGS